MIELNKYADFICSKLISLQVGEALSVNTEEKDFAFAREIANTALKYTKVNSKIVVTEMGRPVDVIEFDADDQSIKANSMAMIRIAHFDIEKEYDKDSLSLVVDKEDMKTIQKLGHLAEPIVINRRIALPWCVVPVFDESDNRWNDIEKTIDCFESYKTAVKYRKQFLEHSDIHFIFISGENTELKIEVPEDVLFASSFSKLRNGREFFSSTDILNLKFTVDKNAVNGYARVKTVVLGKPHEIDVKFKNGIIETPSDSNEIKQLLSFDDEIKKAGFISFKDKSFNLYLGGSITDSLPESCSEEVPAYFNNSLYTLQLSLEDKVNILIEDCEGKKTELVRQGFFLE